LPSVMAGILCAIFAAVLLLMQGALCSTVCSRDQHIKSIDRFGVRWAERMAFYWGDLFHTLLNVCGVPQQQNG
jgi:hypothetical protein